MKLFKFSLNSKRKLSSDTKLVLIQDDALHYELHKMRKGPDTALTFSVLSYHVNPQVSPRIFPHKTQISGISHQH